jgi:hypothetical protein
LSTGRASLDSRFDGDEDLSSLLDEGIQRPLGGPQDAPVVMPKAGSPRGAVAAKVDTSILTEEADEPVRKTDLFAAKPAGDLFG